MNNYNLGIFWKIFIGPNSTPMSTAAETTEKETRTCKEYKRDKMLFKRLT